jgi:hypothetical protein
MKHFFLSSVLIEAAKNYNRFSFALAILYLTVTNIFLLNLLFVYLFSVYSAILFMYYFNTSVSADAGIWTLDCCGVDTDSQSCLSFIHF